MRPSRRVYLIAAATGMAAAIVAVVLVLVFAAGSPRRPHLLAHSSASNSAPGLPIPVDDARAVVVRYLDDINTQNRADAAALICPSLRASWQQKIDKAGGDFTLAITRAEFHGASAAPDGVSLAYDLDVRPRQSTDVQTNTVTFTVTGTPGAYQLCGET